MTLSLIVAYDRNRLIGADNSLPWCIPLDMKYGKSVTFNKTIVMGRNTYESIGKPLSGRNNIILTSDTDFKAEGCLILNCVQSVLDYANSIKEEVIIIGGSID